MKVDITDERRDTDRRVTVGGSELITSKAGWLCFESHDERRRLTPIPADWTRCDEAKLEAYCREARPARLTGADTNCISRYGAVYMVGNIMEYSGDRFYAGTGLDNGIDPLQLGI